MRKRLTQYFPLLTPLRTWQAKTCFTLRCTLDSRYHLKKDNESLPYCIHSTKASMINTYTGFDIRYQYNKAFNLKLLSKQFDHIIISPGQILSFNYLSKNADATTAYKDGLVLVNDDIVIGYGGGLCQLSNMIYEAALHTPLTILKRAGHTSQHLYDPNITLQGIDATVSYGFADLQIQNNTHALIQLSITFPSETEIAVTFYSNEPYNHEIKLTNENLTVFQEKGKTYQQVNVYRIDKTLNTKIKLHTNLCELAYKNKKEGN